MRQHGAADAALDALPDVAAGAGLSSYSVCPEGVAIAEWRAGRRAGARALFLGAPDYPPILATLPDPPPMLWALGDSQIARRPAVALVGARNASSMGLRMARLLATDLGAQGWVIASGMARGIDAQAHSAALATGTIAVLAGGVDTPYPAENTPLYHQILDTGLVVSERPPGFRAQARDFPRRNRLVSGIARGVIVVEAAIRSGSLITARNALDQGREVLAVPGHPLDPRSAGGNMLIRDGAILIRTGDDVAEALGPLPALAPPTASAPPPAPAPTPVHQMQRQHSVPGPATTDDRGADAQRIRDRVMNTLGGAPLSRDQLARDLDLPPARIEDALVLLEIDGRITRGPGGLITLAT
jgi:DNA processing protein